MLQGLVAPATRGWSTLQDVIAVTQVGQRILPWATDLVGEAWRISSWEAGRSRTRSGAGRSGHVGLRGGRGESMGDGGVPSSVQLPVVMPGGQ